MPAFLLVSFKPITAPQVPINPKNAGFWRRQAPFTLVRELQFLSIAFFQTESLQTPIQAPLAAGEALHFEELQPFLSGLDLEDSELTLLRYKPPNVNGLE